MKIHYMTVVSIFSLLSISSSCNVVSWGYSSSNYDDYNTGPQVGFGYSPGFFGYNGGFGLGSLGLLMALLMSRHHPPPPRVVHHHHHHYYKEKPGGGFDYQYKNEGTNQDQRSYGPYGPSNPSGAESRGPKSEGPFSNFFKNMFHRR